MPKKILIVEDTILVAEDLRLLLEEAFHKVTDTIVSFDELETSLTKELPDLVLLDIQLKGEKTGIDAAKVLFERKIPFLFITGQNDWTTFTKAKEYFPVNYILIAIRAIALIKSQTESAITSTVG